MMNNIYTQMQQKYYDTEARRWNITNRDPVVGSFDAHNAWMGYENLFNRIQNQHTKIGLDFGCGPGRNLVKYGTRFKRLDGIDISSVNIEKARDYTSMYNMSPKLYISDGVGLSGVPTEAYDFVMSTICLQHICVYDIRYSIFQDVYRVLTPSGIFTAQMGFGLGHPQAVHYYDNLYNATTTNGGSDVSIESTSQLEQDLIKIGFHSFEYVIDTTGPGDRHPNWIYFSAIK